MTFDLHITVSAKWYPEKKTKYETLRSGWICKSNNPEVETERYETYQEAFESFIQLLKDNWSSTWENYPHIEVGDPIVRGKTDRFTVDSMGEFSFTLPEEEVSVSWSIILTKPVNRTLDEFEPVKSVFEEALPELEKLGEEQGFTVELRKGITPAGEAA